MRWALVLTAIVAAMLLSAVAPTRHGRSGDPTASSDAVRFETVDVTIDAGDEGLAAYQFELMTNEGVTIVGVEGGERGAYVEAPFYDAAALAGGRIIVGALASGDVPPRGATRVARLHMRVEGGVEPRYECVLRIAATAQATKIRDAAIGVREGMTR